MKPLLAIDWGTSSLRGALLGDGGDPIEERTHSRGILTVAPGEFPQVFDRLFGDWMNGARLCLMAGMVGSRQGWQEARYCACPAGFDDIAAHLAWVQPGRIAIVPGLTCAREALAGEPALATHDVMRGEETQVAGALRLLGVDAGTLVLPGTHSKWVRVAGGRIESFATYMTGEFFALLRQHSILGRTLPPADAGPDDAAFALGVRVALQGASLLNTAFSARTVALFDQLAEDRRTDYLSGLVIGEELRAQPAIDGTVIVVGADALTQRYRHALALQGVESRCVGEAASWAGLWAIAESIEAENAR
jgi:2-dehydro-3-deoxygalactonokinase